MHLNARSLKINFDKFKLMWGNLRNLFSVIGMSETWLNDTTAKQVNITGYNFVTNHRKSKSGGWVGIYLFYKIILNRNFDQIVISQTLRRLKHFL